MKPKRSVFLLAAEIQHSLRKGGFKPKNGLSQPSKFACLNIAAARIELGLQDGVLHTPEALMLQELFKPSLCSTYEGWWGNNNEPRILALLLCAEILRK